MSAIASHKCKNLKGRIVVPGDKSISHRALMLGGIAVGETTIHGLLEGEDVLCTAAAMEQMGAQIERPSESGGVWRVYGRGVGGLSEPTETLDMGNSGTAARLMTGLMAAHPFSTKFSGDASLNSRPMARVTVPLEQMGASFVTEDGGRMPMTVKGSDQLMPIEYTLPVASAQVKSAVLFAGLNTAGITTVIESHATRDHSERMLQHFGATVETEVMNDGGRRISVTGYPELTGQAVIVPSDISSAAFPVVAALITPGSHITISGVGMNPLRTGILDTLIEMGGDIQFVNECEEAGEPVADIVVKSSNLTGVVVPPERAPSMIDEYPVLAMAAACASGSTRMDGIGELRVKESDRLGVVARGLIAAGVQLEEGEDWMTVHGTGSPPKGGNMVAAELDHRIAMSFLILGMASDQPITVDDASPMDTSFPGFADLMNDLGAEIK
ncbi:MAG: 3-phosphoshikimate 1-carboxyvinyltransferase [Rhodospirillales bacterium]|nr:3-phosphoshikimate 1-carboxyvinyltransferase [Rhodospirillales bacterium]MBT4040243.1 3-phosphoshikimate 1-carboxyvinyltransferase [Rhodospirillales bacterium]MBT4626552.1 3-phosphoshikimate 1-carboxyvinyltransferase [Rhodospirillales bacterium]MBT5352843.1 3-phosphoshikimate 1-carboxyvinyltransferase [Rhodospirillales bacterium]MBT5522326.1 3-phosphoshikimate 1-carboxyvinyltransferase [Rhodospirillales bacterium]